MSLECYVGAEGNLLEMHPSQCHRLHLATPVLRIEEMAALKMLKDVHPDWPSRVIDITFDKAEGLPGYERALDRISAESDQAILEGVRVIILSDRAVGPNRVPLSALVATGGIHHHLIKNKNRAKVALIIETGEAREVHHVCVLLGYGADAICPYLCFEAMAKLRREGLLRADLSEEDVMKNYCYATNNGILKVMSKMGISVLQSYKGAQTFEALGLHASVIERCFVGLSLSRSCSPLTGAGTASRVSGSKFSDLAMDAFEFHERGYPSRDTVLPPGLPETGEYHWRDGGEAHINDPSGIAMLQDAVREKNQSSYDAYAANARRQVRAVTLRGLLDFDFSKAEPIPLEQVEPWHEIVRRFATGAMSYGSISMEAHATLALAMNRIVCQLSLISIC